LLPAALSAVAFLPAMGNAFLDWDDVSNIVANRDFRGLGWNQIRWAWTTLHMGVYQPLSWMLLSAQYLASGLDPRGYHLTSLLLHAAEAVALYALVVLLLNRSQPDRAASRTWIPPVATALAVSLYMVHPLRTEVVAWASCQPYLPCSLFSTLAIIAYILGHPTDRAARVGWVFVAFLLFTAALLSKAAAITLPAVLLILDVYPLRRLGTGRRPGESGWRILAEKLPFFVLSLVVLAVATQAKARAAYPPRINPGGILERLAQACYGVCFYAIKTAWPSGLSAYVALPDRIVWTEPRFLLSVAVVLGVSLTLWLLRRRCPGLLAAWAAYLVLLAPTSGISRIGATLVSDRYCYLPMMGMVAILAVLIAAMLEALRRRPVAAAGASAILLGLIIGLSVASWHQCRTWRDTPTLWRHALALTDNPAPEMLIYLGSALAKTEGPGAALPHVTRAVQIAPDYPEARLNLGGVLYNLGRLDEAEPQYKEAIRLRTNYAEAYLMLGRISFHRGRLDEAERLLSHAAKLKPEEGVPRMALGGVWMAQGRLAEAEDELRLAIRLGPDDADAYYSLGVCLQREGRSDEAAANYRRALQIRPDYVDALSDLGSLKGQQGQIGEANALFMDALRIKPDHANANYNAGILLARAGRFVEAETHLARAVQSQPDHPSARQALDAVRQLAAQQGRH
jgi:Flp pilus assembly protein TadD